VAYPFLTAPQDTYGFKLAKSNGSETRTFLNIRLPRELPEAQAAKIVNIYQMDEGLNHPGYRVFDTRKIDVSMFDFEISLGALLPADLNWIEGIYKTEKQVMLSWLSGTNYLGVFQSNGLRRMNYPLNIRAFGHCTLAFHLLGTTNQAFS